MGLCFSLQLSAAADDESSHSGDSPKASVISIDGLREYSLPATAAEVLDSETSCSPSSSSSSATYFLCSSDGLCYDEYIPALRPSECLRAGQIYFVLPKSKLQSPLSASDMATLAVRASLALRTEDENRSSIRPCRRRRSNKITQICPVLSENNECSSGSNYEQRSLLIDELGYDSSRTVKSYGSSKPVNVNRSASARKMQRLSSRRMKLAVRSFRMRLSTIYEGSVLAI